MTRSPITLVPVEVEPDAVDELRLHGDEFFGIDLARHNSGVLVTKLADLGVRLLVAEWDGVASGFAGYAHNPANLRQAAVSVSARDRERTTELLAELVRLLRTTARTRSFVSVLRENTSALGAHLAAGFTEAGRLRARRFHDFRYHDEIVLYQEDDS
ncbi:GNAT family N-acetyltransferase [Lentzea sp. NPDC058436]|uniref:GNAT family N-acetyltransferase n=1 Tax=Lentzea sp. NPDC058436 TaxID=3346499 RepID=UPI003669FC38